MRENTTNSMGPVGRILSQQEEQKPVTVQSVRDAFAMLERCNEDPEFLAEKLASGEVSILYPVDEVAK